jgi:outer membrane immunogenic protein
MKTKFWSGVGVVASIVAGVGAASAADLAVNAPVYKAAPVILSDWSGFYIGVNGGYGWTDSTFVNFFDPGDLNIKQKGGLFGGHAGYNWQWGSVVTGLEVDFDAADIHGTAPGFISEGVVITDAAKTNELASARARVGYLLTPSLLAYGTAGAGWAHTNFNDNFGDVGGISQFGWVAGVGLEYKVYNNWIARSEYLHYDFGLTDNTFGPFRETIDVVRGGLSYKF